MLKLVRGQNRERFLNGFSNSNFIFLNAALWSYQHFFLIVWRNFSAAPLPTTKSTGWQKGWELRGGLQEGLGLTMSLGARQAHTLGETHLAVVLELHPASIAESLQWGEAQLDWKSKADRTAIKGVSRAKNPELHPFKHHLPIFPYVHTSRIQYLYLNQFTFFP